MNRPQQAQDRPLSTYERHRRITNRGRKTMTTPEQQARAKLDTLLQAAGWVVQDSLLFLDGKAAGVIEAKKSGVTLSGVAEQSEKYMLELPAHLARWDTHLQPALESSFCAGPRPLPG